MVAVWTAGKEGLSRLESWGRWKVGLAGFFLVLPTLVVGILVWYDEAFAKRTLGITYTLRRGTIAQVTTALDAAQRAAEDELALNEAGWDR